MTLPDLPIDPDIRKAATLPGRFYGDPSLHALVLERAFARSWQLVDPSLAVEPGAAAPFTLLPGSLDEPLLLARDAAGVLRCLSNVCTHRGAVLCEESGPVSGFRCRYHGRRFSPDGKFLSMPEFDAAEGFPSPSDDLPRAPLGLLGKLVFVSLRPAVGFAELLGPVVPRLSFLPVGDGVFDPMRFQLFEVAASWALYVDNYLEGLHIPFVHPSLAGALDLGTYRTELFPWGSIQIAEAKDGEAVFALPATHPDAGRRIAAYYVWLFPNTMLNVYPWGISVNVVLPRGPDRSAVGYHSYVWDESRLDAGASAGLDAVEVEDEAVVESCQKGVRSRLYRSGRFSPSRETGVWHFHRLLAGTLRGEL